VGDQFLIPGRGGNFLFPNISRLALWPTQLSIQWVLGLWHEADDISIWCSG